MQAKRSHTFGDRTSFAKKISLKYSPKLFSSKRRIRGKGTSTLVQDSRALSKPARSMRKLRLIFSFTNWKYSNNSHFYWILKSRNAGVNFLFLFSRLDLYLRGKLHNWPRINKWDRFLENTETLPCSFSRTVVDSEKVLLLVEVVLSRF